MTETMKVRHYARFVRTAGGMVEREIVCGAVCEPETPYAAKVHDCDSCARWIEQNGNEVLAQAEFMFARGGAVETIRLAECGVRESKNKLRKLVMTLPLAKE